ALRRTECVVPVVSPLDVDRESVASRRDRVTIDRRHVVTAETCRRRVDDAIVERNRKARDSTVLRIRFERDRDARVKKAIRHLSHTRAELRNLADERIVVDAPAIDGARARYTPGHLL